MANLLLLTNTSIQLILSYNTLFSVTIFHVEMAIYCHSHMEYLLCSLTVL